MTDVSPRPIQLDLAALRDRVRGRVFAPGEDGYTLWPILAEHGFRPIGQVAIDETWSALRFRPRKPGEAQFTGGR